MGWGWSIYREKGHIRSFPNLIEDLFFQLGGPKPFKTNDCWFENKGFLKFVENEWKKFKVGGRSDYIIKGKFKLLKGSLR